MGYDTLEVGNVVTKKIALVSGFKYNLLSVIPFCERGFKVDFDKNNCSVIHKKE